MAVLTVTSREISQNPARAKRAAEKGPVSITNRGRVTHVLLSIERYRQLTGKRRSLLRALSAPGLSTIKLTIPRARQQPKPARLD